MSNRFTPHSRYHPPRPGFAGRYGEHDRWERRTSPRARSRSPTLDRREIDTDRARHARDGPASAGSNISDASRFPSTFRGSSYTRGRGRDWGEYRGRSRYPPDERDRDRDNFRPRSHSRGPRRERDRSVDSRDFDRRDDYRDRREDEYRDRREDDYRDRREDEWRYHRGRDDREREYGRRDPGARPLEGRVSDPLPPAPPRPASPHGRPAAPEPRKDYDLSRRPSAISEHSVGKEPRRDSDRSDGAAASRVRQPSPQIAPVVPQFGTFAAGSLVWNNPNLQSKTAQLSPTSTSPLTKVPPTAPRALAPVPPTAPKADRVVEKPPPVKETTASEDTKPKDVAASPKVAVVSPVAWIKPESPTIEPSPTMSANQPEGQTTPSQTRLLPPSAPTGPRVPPQAFAAATSSSSGPIARDASPNAIPTGPRIAPAITGSPKGLPANIPTGPKAERAQPPRTAPTAPRAANFARTSVPNLQWRPGSQPQNQHFPARQLSAGVKRDANGDEKERTPAPESLSLRDPSNKSAVDEKLGIQPIKEVSESKPRAASGPTVAMNGSGQDVNMVDAPEGSRQEAALHLSDEDDDMDLSEEDFAEHAAKFAEKKRNLEALLSDISADEQQLLVTLDELLLLVEVSTAETELPFAPTPPPETAPTTDLERSVASPSPEAGKVDTDEVMKDMTPEPYASPDLECLPYLAQRPPTPLSNPDYAFDGEDVELAVREKLKAIENEESAIQNGLRDEFAEKYHAWRRQTDELSQSRKPSEASLEPQLTPDPNNLAAAGALPAEGRRALKYSSELELERALAESLKEAELKAAEEQRKSKGQVNPEREAEIPTILPTFERDLRKFKDTSLLRKPEDALRIFEFAPPEDSFTDKEDEILRLAYAQNMKMWIKIADVVGRTPKECIYHYYATKWEKPYKKSAGKRGKARGPRKGIVRKKPEVEQPQDQPMTESGRPRRAAAPKFMTSVQNGKNDDLDDGSGGKKANARGDPATGEEKAGRRGRAAKEKAVRKPRNQPLVSKGVPSPVKPTKEKKDKMPPLETEGWPKQEQMLQERPMPALLPQQQFIEHTAPAFPVSKPDVVAAPPATVITTVASVATERPRSHSQPQRSGPSSYWSVTEEQDFKACLQYFGTDYQAIANHMGSKTHTMIKNHFQKYRQDEAKNHELLEQASAADARRERGEHLGDPPPQLSKKRLEVAQPHSRLPPSAEQMEDVPSPSLQTNLQAHGSPSFQPQRYPVPAAASHATPPMTVSPAGQQQVANPNQQRIQRIGTAYYDPQSHRQVQIPPQGSPGLQHQEPVRLGKPVTRIKTEYEPRAPHPVHDSDRAIRGEREAHFGQPPREVERLPHGLSPQSAVHQGPGLVNMRGSVNDQPPADHQHYNMIPAASRSVIDLTSSEQPGMYDPGHGHRPPSPRHQDVAMSGTHSAPPPPIAKPREQPPEPSRKINIMSMLNPEPSEQPKRKEPDRPPQQPQHIHSDHPGQREMYGAPPEQYRDAYRERQPPHRDAWQQQHQPYQGQPPMTTHAGSPHIQQPQPVHGDRGMVRDYRSAAFNQLNNGPAHVPSPPPAAFHHSRTPSYPQQPPPPHHPHSQPPVEPYHNSHGAPPMGPRHYGAPAPGPPPRGEPLPPQRHEIAPYGNFPDGRQQYAPAPYEQPKPREFEQHRYTPQPAPGQNRYPPPGPRSGQTPLGGMGYAPPPQAQQPPPPQDRSKFGHPYGISPEEEQRRQYEADMRRKSYR